ncbi:MAG: hypothetical protein IT281_03820, partial [Ignavibacteria bacterium]|nr:hypothetical protein [Ignavibacteria bacterium]
MKLHKLLSTSICIITAVLILSTIAYSQTGIEYSSSTLIIKFRAGTELINQARLLAPKNYYDRLVFSDPRMESTGSLSSFMERNYIKSIRAVKPDADLTPLPGGMERIFIIELFNLAPIETVQFKLSSDPEIEYA